MEMDFAMQSVKVVMRRGSQKNVRNLHLMKKEKQHVTMSFIIWWRWCKNKRSMSLAGWKEIKDVYSMNIGVGEEL